MVAHKDGNITLYRDRAERRLPKLHRASFDLAIVDMPYGITRNEWDVMPDLQWLWTELHRVVKTNGAIICFAQGGFAADLINSNRKWFRYDLVWEKDRPSGFLNSGRMPLRSHEQLLVFYKKLPTYNPQMIESGKPHHGRGKRGAGNIENQGNYGAYKGKKTDDGETSRHPRSVLKFARPHPVLHPTQKPIELIEWLIKTYSEPGDRILDPYAGTATTLLVCQSTGRAGLGIEANKAIFAQAVYRLKGN